METRTDRVRIAPVRPAPQKAGWIEVICGSMFAGKTLELIRRLRLATIARQPVQAFKSGLDTRYRVNYIVSHDKSKIRSVPVRRAEQILTHVQPNTEVVGIDEAHFFGPALVKVCERLADEGRRVIVAGLEQDFRGKPFMTLAKLMAVAEYVTKNLAICVVCAAPANRNQRISGGRRRIDVGHSDKYEARCRRCFSRA